MDLVRSAEAAGPAGQPVKFQSSLEAATYCEERLREGWLVASDSSGADKGASRTRLSHPGLDKERMFHQEGKSLVQLLASGVAELDSRLNTVRLDRFGNVMIWEAPEWSPASAQFTHGFPRRMIEAAHGGFLPGNIVVTAKASNLSIRRMTVCDVASLVSRVAIAGSGLSVGHLSNLRYAAARYRRCGSYLPDYLIRGMLEFGVNFLSFQAVEPDTLEALSKTVGKAWAHAEQEDGDDEDESMASGSLPEDVLSSLGHRPTPEGAASVPTVERDQALSMIRSNSVAERLGGDGEVQERVLEVQRPGDQAAPKRKRRKGSSSGGRAKKPNTPAVVNDSGDSSDNGDADGTLPAAARSAADPYGLERCPVRNLRKDVFPEGQARKKLYEFFDRRRPLDPQVLRESASAGARKEDIFARPGDVYCMQQQESATQERVEQVRGLLASLFEKCRHRCSCTDGDCAFRSGTRPLAADPAPPCQSESCEICSVFKAQPRDIYHKGLGPRNQRLNQLLCCCPAISELYHLAKYTGTMPTKEAEQHLEDVRRLVRELVMCGQNRLNCMVNIGEMAGLAPRILCVQLTGGYSEFWNELRTVAKAINKQPHLDCKLAALVAIRKSIAPGNHWSFYLEADESHRRRELEILQEWTAAISSAASESAATSTTVATTTTPRR